MSGALEPPGLTIAEGTIVSDAATNRPDMYGAMADAFVAEGVRAVFTVMGHANLDWLVAMGERATVDVVHTFHEGAAVNMADAWGRAAGMPGVCSTTCGPGLTQTATQLMAAARAGVPLVLFAGDDFGTRQDFDQSRFAAACEAGFEPLRRAADARHVVHKAFYRARNERRPVLLDVPVKLAAHEEIRPATPFPNPHQVIAPDPSRLDELAEVVRGASRPVIVVGQGAMAQRDLAIASADRTGALLATTLPARGLFRGLPNDAGIAGNLGHDVALELLPEADLVIGLGMTFDRYTTIHGRLFPAATIVHVDRRPTFPLGTGQFADHYVQSDAGMFLEWLAGLELDDVPQHGAWRQRGEAALADIPTDDEAFPLDEATGDPRLMVRAVDTNLRNPVGFVAGSGHCFATVVMNTTHPYTTTSFANGFGAIGQGLAASVGVAVATGDPVVVYIGDTSMMVHVQELATAVRYGLPILVVVLNDAALGAELHHLSAHGLDMTHGVNPELDFAAIAQSMGAVGHSARTPDEAAQATRDFMARPRPTVIDAKVSRTVVSKLYRRTGIDSTVQPTNRSAT